MSVAPVLFYAILPFIPTANVHLSRSKSVQTTTVCATREKCEYGISAVKGMGRGEHSFLDRARG